MDKHTLLFRKMNNFLIDSNGCGAFIYIYKLVVAVIMRDVVKVLVFYAAHVRGSVHFAAFVYCFYVNRLLFLIIPKILINVYSKARVFLKKQR